MTIFIALCLIATCIATDGEHECPANEVFKTCGTACESTCENPNASSGPCIEVCISNVCQCAPGFVRNSSGACVKYSQCSEPTPKCGENEEFKECGTHCEPTCKEPNPACIMMCKENVCQCKKGFVRHEKACILQVHCPKLGL
ncbi:hypothetical protein CRE_12826 [Caenorhabditis remanei]|uniref:TIL domain-containing protein n=1 Tax=Caenorhabditis remanei TaxID=31234 RepID=E3MQP8_CAERE|nr:hypothetical protein CRE_12826 [Caenorhabditis remanei]